MTLVTCGKCRSTYDARQDHTCFDKSHSIEKVTSKRTDGATEVKDVDREGKVLKTEVIPKKSILG